MRKSAAKQAAKAVGAILYCAEISCPIHGEPTTRYVSTGKCIDCCRGEGPRYKDKRTAYSVKNSGAIVARVAKWKADNPEKVRNSSAKYRERHRDAIKAKSVIYRKAHPTDRKMRVIREARRRARKKTASGQFTCLDVQFRLGLQRFRCAYCRKSLRTSFSVDHVMPLALNGSNDARNIQLVCRRCNSSKGGKHPVDFAKYLGLLI